MRPSTFIGLRYLWSTRRSRFLSLITFITISGIAIGVMALITVQAVMDGFQNQMKRSVLGSRPNIRVVLNEEPFSDYEKPMTEIAKIKGISGVTPVVSGEVIVSANQEVTGGMLAGIDTASVGSVILLPEQMKLGKVVCLKDKSQCAEFFEPKVRGPGYDMQLDRMTPEQEKNAPPVILGVEMARYLDVKPGDPVTLISPMGGGLGPTGPMPLSKRFILAGTFFTGMYEYDFGMLYMDITDAQEFFSMQGKITEINAKLTDIFAADSVVQQLKTVLPQGFTAATWKEMNKNLFNALQMEKIVMFLILGFIVLVASFNIVSTLVMMVMGRTREVAILKALGLSNAGVMRIFIFDGMILGILGTIVGMVSGYGLCRFIDGSKLPFGQDVYYMSEVPVDMSVLLFAGVGVAALAVSLVATLYPSKYAASIRPAEGLRLD